MENIHKLILRKKGGSKMNRKREKRVVSDNFALSMVRTLIAVVLLTFIGVTPALSSDSDCDCDQKIIDGEFKIQPYEVPEKYRHMTAIGNEEKEEVILFGGITFPDGWPPPSNNVVRTLDLTKPSDEQEWEYRWEDAAYPNGVVGMPWFTSASGFIELNNNYYLTCDDQNLDIIWSLDPETYEITEISRAPDGARYQASDCCAVGVTMPRTKEERIYILGGREGPSGDRGPHSDVRYYSITKDKWKYDKVANMHVKRSHLGCATVEQKNGEPLIYAISGGQSVEIGELDGPRVLSSIEIYNVKKNKWTLYPDYFPEFKGRSRFGRVQNFHNKYLLLLGGDAACAGGYGDCPPGQPTTWVDVIDIKRNRLISDDCLIPQLKIPRQTPATALIKREGKYELYVVGGQTGIDYKSDELRKNCTACHPSEYAPPMPLDEPFDHSGYTLGLPRACTGCHPFHKSDLLATTEKLSFDGINVDDDD